jgi:hypothetical protein
MQISPIIFRIFYCLVPCSQNNRKKNQQQQKNIGIDFIGKNISQEIACHIFLYRFDCENIDVEMNVFRI